MATAIPNNHASFELSELAACSGGRIQPVHGSVQVRSVVTDSRAAQAGSLYVAIKGERHDGHAYLAQAQAAGAAAAVIEAAAQAAAPNGLPVVVVEDTRRALGEIGRLHRARWGKPLVAITGSAGKTTTKELTAAALRGVGQNVLATVGNLNNEIGLPMTLFGLSAEHTVAVVEIGTGGPGEIAWLTHVAEPNAGVVTTVALAHVAKLKTLADVAEEKTALLKGLPREGTAIYSVDSDELRARVNTFGARRVIGFGQAADAQLRLSRCELRADLSMSVEYKLEGEAAARSFTLNLYGQSAAVDALAALAVVLGLHGPSALAQAEAGMRSVKPLPGRLSPRTGAQGALIIDDSYNANPASMAASLRTLAELSRVRRGQAIAALGDMAELGSHAQPEHERIGRLVVELGLSDVFFCGPEMAHAAAVARSEVQARRAKGPRVHHHADPNAVASELMRMLDASSAVLVKGSRALAMERVADALCPDAGGAA
ncbi:MAG TPA: UDP-N-acetylmuramoyl-tripeptide--D-alanyl-D-alanine ligase [Polyangiales bacterium]|jgi:UDP-N-acetylmuramoyl-tripeptide--D-alanyl-D-alanine ligase|nr:UDP-N-acetylmuramoyl-tripeptide--D-alanyl-D-alanine ligase [Polyangiales bacterium]